MPAPSTVTAHVPIKDTSKKPSTSIISGAFLLAGSCPLFAPDNGGSMYVKEGLNEVAVRLRELPVNCYVSEQNGKREVIGLHFEGITPPAQG